MKGNRSLYPSRGPEDLAAPRGREGKKHATAPQWHSGWRAPAVALLLAAFVGILGGCGVDALLVNAIDGQEHAPPVTLVKGTLDGIDGEATFEIVGGDGLVVTPLEITWEGRDFTLDLPPNVDYRNLQISASAGNITLFTLVPEVRNDTTVEIGTLGPESTAAFLLLQARLAIGCLSLAQLPPERTAAAWGVIETTARDGEGATAAFFGMVDRLIRVYGDETSEGAPIFVPFSFVLETNTLSGGLSEDFLAAGTVDYDGDGQPDPSPEAFLALVESAVRTEIPFPEDFGADYVLIRVVMTTNLNEGQKDGNCATLDRFKWVNPDPGDSVFFTGGIHEDSPIQDDAIHEMLGAWTPNEIPMFDDGTNGDEVANDGIWTIVFDLPVGLRFGYKYTYGKAGEGWTGTEEWPGNSRILEVVDVNGDGFVVRNDNFADEATNKDKVNLNQNGDGTLAWDDDWNGDGIPDTRERPDDTDGDCIPDTWHTPGNLEPIESACQ